MKRLSINAPSVQTIYHYTPTNAHLFNHKHAIMMTMANFNRERRPSGDRNFGRRDFAGRDRSRGFDRGEDRQMYKTTCSNCGKQCEVPFRPTNGKPVYCSDCFKNSRRGASLDSPRPEGSDFRAPGFDQNKNEFDALNIKLDKILRILEPKIPVTVVPAQTPKDPQTTPELKKIKPPKAKKMAKKSTSA